MKSLLPFGSKGDEPPTKIDSAETSTKENLETTKSYLEQATFEYENKQFEQAKQHLRLYIDNTNVSTAEKIKSKILLLNILQIENAYDESIALAQEILENNESPIEDKITAHLFWAEGLAEMNLFTNAEQEINSAKDALITNKQKIDDNKYNELLALFHFESGKFIVLKQYTDAESSKLIDKATPKLLEESSSKYITKKLNALSAAQHEFNDAVLYSDKIADKNINLTLTKLEKLAIYAKNFDDAPEELTPEQQIEFKKGVKLMLYQLIAFNSKEIVDKIQNANSEKKSKSLKKVETAINDFYKKIKLELEKGNL